MNTNDYMYAIDRSDEYLAHYGIKGMKWGVRKAIERGNSRALTRQYNKAARKLAKLQKRAENGKKYARRAAALGAGAAAAGGLAAAGTEGVGNLVRGAGRLTAAGSVRGGAAMRRLGTAMTKAGIRGGGRVFQAGSAMTKHGLTAGRAVQDAGKAVQTWGASNSIGKAAGVGVKNAVNNMNSGTRMAANKVLREASIGGLGTHAENINQALKNTSNNTIARIGAGALGAGLAAGAGYNAYRAATTKRAAKKAAEFQREMNQAFKGTQYGNGGNSNRKRRKR